MKAKKGYWQLIIFLSCLLVVATVFGEWLLPARGIIVFGFLLFCPGLALAYLIPTRDIATKSFLVIVLSIGIDTTVSEIMLYLGKWSPRSILIILIAICLLSTFFELFINFDKRKIVPRARL